MNVENMRHFIELARVGSFYGTAKRLFISQQGLNRAVSAMEKELGVKLVERDRRGVHLTKDGDRFLDFARTCVAAYDDMVDDLYASKGGAHGGDPLQIHITYYAAQIAAEAPGYVDLIANSSYLEESFDKILSMAESSNGSDLNFVDLHGNTVARVLTNPHIAFDPFISTKVGVVWKDGFPLAGHKELHRADVANMPLAHNSFREMAQLTEWVFRNHPLGDVRMLTASPRMLLDFVRYSKAGVALFDSFSYYLLKNDPHVNTEGLHFTPLSTPDAVSYIGFVYPKHVRPTARAQRAVTLFSQYLEEHCAEYFKEYPLDRP